jgi:hypothetical protein
MFASIGSVNEGKANALLKFLQLAFTVWRKCVSIDMSYS